MNNRYYKTRIYHLLSVPLSALNAFKLYQFLLEVPFIPDTFILWRELEGLFVTHLPVWQRPKLIYRSRLLLFIDFMPTHLQVDMFQILEDVETFYRVSHCIVYFTDFHV